MSWINRWSQNGILRISEVFSELMLTCINWDQDLHLFRSRFCHLRVHSLHMWENYVEIIKTKIYLIFQTQGHGRWILRELRFTGQDGGHLQVQVSEEDTGEDGRNRVFSPAPTRKEGARFTGRVWKQQRWRFSVPPDVLLRGVSEPRFTGPATPFFGHEEWQPKLFLFFPAAEYPRVFYFGE